MRNKISDDLMNSVSADFSKRLHFLTSKTEGAAFQSHEETVGAIEKQIARYHYQYGRTPSDSQREDVLNDIAVVCLFGAASIRGGRMRSLL